MKICSKCGIKKKSLDFWKRGKHLRSECKICENKSKSLWKKNNRLKYNKLKRRYYHKHDKKLKDLYGLSCGTIKRYGFKLAIIIYDKFNRKCYQCGNKNDLVIHHLDNRGQNYVNRGLEPNDNEKNLVLICRSCHGKIHGKEGGRGNKKPR